MRCPKCNHSRFWRLRREHARCKKCRHEWSLKNYFTPSLRIDLTAWKSAIDSFVRDKTILAVCSETGLKRSTVHKMLTILRQLMFKDIQSRFEGPIEIDDAYLGPRWHNRKWNKHTTKRGRGTDQQPILGIYDRKTRAVYATCIQHVCWKFIKPIIESNIVSKATIYSDTYQSYRPLKRFGFRHETVDHGEHEYARGEINVNHIESFWGYMKRKFKVTGGLRRNRLNLFLAEWVWMYNHRKLSRNVKVNLLVELLKNKFGGRF